MVYNSTPPGTLEIRATDNISNFGYWESPVFGLQAMGEQVDGLKIPLIVPELNGRNIFALEFRLVGDAPEQIDVPEVRFRTTAENSQQSDLMVISSNTAGGISPYARGNTNSTLYFMPAAGSPDFRLQFDMLNFATLSDSADSMVALDYAQICHIPASQIEAPRLEAHYEFQSPLNGWTTETHVEAGYLAPIFRYDLGRAALSLKPVPSGDSFVFGYWGSPEVGELVRPETGRLYYATFTVESDQTDASMVPSFRVRINESGFRVAQYLQVASTGTAFNSPTVGNPKEYTVFFPPNVATDGAYLIYSFDMVTQDSDGDSLDTTIFLNEISVFSIPIPKAGFSTPAP